jgi:hypothetical protein
MKPLPTDEEARVLLRKIVEGQAYRQLMLSNIRAHGIKFLPELEDKITQAERLTLSLVQFREVQRLHSKLSGTDVVSAVRGRMERIPYPASRMELAVCLFLCMRAERAALGAYVDSAAADFAAIARTRLEITPPGELPRDATFVEFCADPSNRPHAQQMVNRWLAICLLSLGRPGSPGDARALALGLRTRRVSEIVSEFLAGLAPFFAACSLCLPDADALGVELPADAQATARRA